MRVVVQRVQHANVVVAGQAVGTIGRGLLVLVGFRAGDGDAELDWMARKLIGLRLFEDGEQKMNLGLEEVAGELLLVPQFTLYGDARKSRRPSFTEALAPEQATVLFDRFCEQCGARGVTPQRGIFGAHMQVSLLNDGPVTLIIDSP